MLPATRRLRSGLVDPTRLKCVSSACTGTGRSSGRMATSSTSRVHANDGDGHSRVRPAAVRLKFSSSRVGVGSSPAAGEAAVCGAVWRLCGA